MPEAEWTRNKVLDNPAEIRRVTKLGTVSGEKGYINYTSGWADSEMAMRHMRAKAEATGRISFVNGTVRRLLFSQDREKAVGAALEDGKELHADLTVVAAGAWCPALLDLRGLVTASGQVLAYLEISPEEQEYLSKCPAQLDLSTGMFFVPPPPLDGGEASRHNFLKLARHGYGYCNPVDIPEPESDDASATITVSLPHTSPATAWGAQTVPDEAIDACRNAIRTFFPVDAASLPADAPKSLPSLQERAIKFARLCHYADTPSHNFLISYHPKYDRSLFVATGGSGHGFKFAPVLGDEIVKCIMGEPSEDFRERWAWPDEKAIEEAKASSAEAGGPGWYGDGDRGGKEGMMLQDEMRKSKHNGW